MIRLANSAKVASELSNTAYAAWELLGNVNGAMLSPDDARKLAKTRDALMTHSAGAYVPKVPAAVLETLSWVQMMAQERATDSDFQTAREALDEHDALRFVTYWLEVSGVDVTAIRGAELKPEARAAYEAEAAAEQERLDALERDAENEAFAKRHAALDSPESVAETVAYAFGGFIPAVEALGYMVRERTAAPRFYAVSSLGATEADAVAGFQVSREGAAKAALIVHASDMESHPAADLDA